MKGLKTRADRAAECALQRKPMNVLPPPIQVYGTVTLTMTTRPVLAAALIGPDRIEGLIDLLQEHGTQLQARFQSQCRSLRGDRSGMRCDGRCNGRAHKAQALERLSGVAARAQPLNPSHRGRTRARSQIVWRGKREDRHRACESRVRRGDR
jgi:hypothetical protein